MRWVYLLLCGLLGACGGAPFTVEFATADDGGQALGRDDGGLVESSDPPEASLLEAGADVPVRLIDAGPDALTFRWPDAEMGGEADARPDTAITPDAAGDAGLLDAPLAQDVAADVGPPPVCAPGAARCNGLAVETCNPAGQWAPGTTCSYVCSNGTCGGVCSPSAVRCTDVGSGAQLQTCDATGQWGAGTQCPAYCQCRTTATGPWMPWNCTNIAGTCPSSYASAPTGACATSTSCLQ